MDRMDGDPDSVQMAHHAVNAATNANNQGTTCESPLSGRTVTITAKGTSGFFIQEAHTSDVRVSSGIHVFTSFKTVLARLAIGDPLSLSLSGNVADFRSSSDPSFLFAIELDDGVRDGVWRASWGRSGEWNVTGKNSRGGLSLTFGTSELFLSYDSPKFSLVPGSPAGGSLDGTDPKADSDGAITLTFNPGGTELTNAAWDGSRKPLVGHWEAQSVVRLFTINVYLTATLGGTSARDDPQPPEEDVDKRTRQIEVVAASDAVAGRLPLDADRMLDKDEDTNVVVAGDHSEHTQTRSAFAAYGGMVTGRSRRA
ncbi:hypothetical protein BD311DRAFT_795217 [Dichomitus squalens]|uniref:Uncharacterized protein n=1 Tax=Dichomitus squalens TaxID=114155 RepID=A0A4Q9MZ29_9APHY|nr:hypothetical protein BD311DRAFT_795217 [Dichomitus squalens]